VLLCERELSSPDSNFPGNAHIGTASPSEQLKFDLSIFLCIASTFIPILELAFVGSAALYLMYIYVCHARKALSHPK
jgi:hypothetical protein